VLLLLFFARGIVHLPRLAFREVTGAARRRANPADVADLCGHDRREASLGITRG
jgi:hypothetical protein